MQQKKHRRLVYEAYGELGKLETVKTLQRRFEFKINKIYPQEE